jgi:uncharacterized protein YcbX
MNEPEAAAYPVTSIRRYPVKSMGGETLDRALLDRRGIVGDRWYAVEDDDGHFASGKNTRRFRRRDAVFAYSAQTDADGVVRVARDRQEWTVGDSLLDEHLSTHMKTAVRVTAEASVPHQDMGAVSIIGTATLDWCAATWGGDSDPRRLRVNIVAETDRPFIEEDWQGADLHVGSTVLRVVERVPRCRMIDIAQDGVSPQAKWLKKVSRDRGLFLAVYADVRTAGEVAIGEHVTASPADVTACRPRSQTL